MTSKSSMEELKKEWDSKFLMSLLPSIPNVPNRNIPYEMWEWITTNFIPREEVEGLRRTMSYSYYEMSEDKNTEDWIEEIDKLIGGHNETR